MTAGSEISLSNEKAVEVRGRTKSGGKLNDDGEADEALGADVSRELVVVDDHIELRGRG